MTVVSKIEAHPTNTPDDGRRVVIDLHAANPAGDPALVLKNLLTTLRESAFVGCAGVADQIEAQAKPPRIPEPGLWGVVETTFKDGCSRHGWAVRRLTDGDCDWQDGSGDYHRWEDLINPILIREGINA